MQQNYGFATFHNRSNRTLHVQTGRLFLISSILESYARYKLYDKHKNHMLTRSNDSSKITLVWG